LSSKTGFYLKKKSEKRFQLFFVDVNDLFCAVEEKLVNRYSHPSRMLGFSTEVIDKASPWS
jgi:hypothetical protein